MSDLDAGASADTLARAPQATSGADAPDQRLQTTKAERAVARRSSTTRHTACASVQPSARAEQRSALATRLGSRQASGPRSALTGAGAEIDGTSFGQS